VLPAPAGGDAGVQHHQIDASERIESGARERFDIAVAGDVAMDGDASLTGGLHGGRCGSEAVGVDVGHHHVGALARESERTRPPDPVGAAGDHRDLLVKLHLHSSTRESAASRLDPTPADGETAGARVLTG